MLGGLLITATVFPLLTPSARHSFKQRWCRGVMGALGVRWQVDALTVAPGSLLVANHVSWLDVFLINAAFPAAFVSKAEVRDWPVAGWLATRHETVFLRRGSRGHARLVNEEIGALLGKGHHVAVFPEGTTTDGSHVLGFHAALLQPAIHTGAPVQPLAITYRDGNGCYTRDPAYDGDVSLVDSLKAIVANPALVARIGVSPALSSIDTPDRKALAHAAREAIAAQVAA